jgi:four helix bundle protein
MKNKKGYQDIEKRAFNFGVRIIKMVDVLPKKTACFVIGRQVIESATSIHSNIIHARASLTKKEFINYMNNASREAKETKGWIEISVACNFIKQKLVEYLLKENDEIISILVTICKKCSQK